MHMTVPSTVSPIMDLRMQNLSLSSDSRPAIVAHEDLEIHDAHTEHVPPRFPTVQLTTVKCISDDLARSNSNASTDFSSLPQSQDSSLVRPVAQLNKLSTSSKASPSKAKARKHRLDLLESLDVLSSHLDTTFTSLSVALALARSSTPRATLAILFGPSITTPKSKIFFNVDGFETTKALAAPPSPKENRDAHRIVSRTSPLVDSTISPYVDRGGASDSEDDEETEEEEARRLSKHFALREADRLLSRTIVGDYQGLSDEIAPTNVHILLRAPRRFDHPTWTPRQNVASTLDKDFDDFLVGLSCLLAPDHFIGRKLKFEGISLTSSTGSIGPVHKDSDEEEDDELIWWIWNGGRIAGFCDW
ncbi:hypothetical protein DL96DRAFT_1553657 [Flagelloscypha sp. PMI_526]|nr:hypothetical protein DL96DRAFT_1553657 [Flagelloscypha sp. PMI_526]